MKPHAKTIVEVKMLIRRPVDEVFQAMIDPEITTNFWFTKSTGKLIQGKSVKWEWEMYGASTEVYVKQVIPNSIIKFDWGSPPTTVEFNYKPFSDNSTYVTIKNYGYNLEGEDLIEAIKDNTGGFTTMIDGMKAYLEHGIQLNLVADKFPDKHKK